mmetsp:Transcript_14867/g.42659  ORF Transcript_14867/g.42659 Transcript_14867/m.42659 type:complete len:105 (+) Transcript_14867:19-333(+)
MQTCRRAARQTCACTQMRTRAQWRARAALQTEPQLRGGGKQREKRGDGNGPPGRLDVIAAEAPTLLRTPRSASSRIASAGVRGEELVRRGVRSVDTTAASPGRK